MQNTCARFFSHNKDLGLLILRLSIGIVMFIHGIEKLSDMHSCIAFFAHLGMPAFMAWLVALSETVGGALLILGFWTWFGACIIAIEMLVIILWLNWGKPFDKYNMELIILASSLAIALMGSGRYALGKKCAGCKSCDCSCHPADERCGEGKCDSCGCR